MRGPARGDRRCNYFAHLPRYVEKDVHLALLNRPDLVLGATAQGVCAPAWGLPGHAAVRKKLHAQAAHAQLMLINGLRTAQCAERCAASRFSFEIALSIEKHFGYVGSQEKREIQIATSTGGRPSAGAGSAANPGAAQKIQLAVQAVREAIIAPPCPPVVRDHFLYARSGGMADVSFADGVRG